jgi:energy-coupling factor transporter ATP-binding protein EcfA2
MTEQHTAWLDRFLDAPPPELDDLPFDAVDLACMVGMAMAWNTAPALGLLVTGVSIAQRIGRRHPTYAGKLLALTDHHTLAAKLLPGAQQQTPPATTRHPAGDLADLIHQPPAQHTPTAAPPQKTARAWLKFVNDDIDARPSLAILGPPGSGKTTLTTGLLLPRTGQICVISAKTDDEWSGLPYISMDDDLTYTTAERALVEVHQTMLHRYQKRKIERQNGIPNTLEPITIVLDDFAELRLQCPSAVSVALSLARLGRAVRMRLVLMSYSQQVEELGLRGLGESRAFFVTIRTKAVEQTNGMVTRTATMEYQGITYAIETEPVVDLARRFRFESGRWWEPLPKPVDGIVSTVSTDDELLAGLLKQPIRVGNSIKTQDTSLNQGSPEVSPRLQGVSPSFEFQVSPEEAAMIAMKLTNGETPTQVAKGLPGYNSHKFKLYKAKVDYVKTQLDAAASAPPTTGEDDDVPPAFKRAMGRN